MSAAAVMLVRDEQQIIETTVRHLLANVDTVYVLDNRSTDLTPMLLDRLRVRHGSRVVVEHDPEVGYFQDRKTTELARRAHADGHEWIVPCDADELWYAPAGYPLNAWLSRLPRSIGCVQARLLNHVDVTWRTVTTDSQSIVDRLPHRLIEAGALPKVAVRWTPDAWIEMGNHGARGYAGAVGGGLLVRHFPWRGENEYVRKIRNGQEAYAATDYPDAIGSHWRVWEGKPDEAIREHYRRWFIVGDDRAHEVVYDPATVMA